MKEKSLFESLLPPLPGTIESGTLDYEYICRSDRKEIIEYRVWWNEVFEHCRLSLRRKREIKQRIKSKSFEQHRSGLFELFVYKFFSEVGFRVHSGKKLGRRNPDFFIFEEPGMRIHLEATCILSEPSFAHGRGLNGFVLDLIRSLSNKKYRFLVDYRGNILDLPSKRKLQNEIQKWLNSLDSESIIRIYETTNDIYSIPSRTFNDKRLAIELWPLPRAIEKFSRGVSNIWGVTSPAEVVRTDQTIYNRVKEKASQCKAARLPVVIAINLSDISAGLDEVYDALFGKESIRLHMVNRKVVKTEEFRQGKGAFRLGDQTINTNVSGLLLFYGVNHDPLPRSKPVLLLNPFRKIKSFCGPIKHVRVIDPLNDNFTFPQFEKDLREDWDSSRSSWPLAVR